MLRASIVIAAVMAASTASAACFGSDTMQTCTDTSGNSYTTHRFGNMSQTYGRNSRTGSSWSQSTTDYGSSSYTTGRAANGNSWNMNQQDLGNGWSTYNGRDSDGDYFSGTCGPLGCN